MLKARTVSGNLGISKKFDRERPLFWLVIVNSILTDLENIDIAYAHVIVILLSVMVNALNLLSN